MIDRKFAPRCCVCEQPIMPETGSEEAVRIVAMDRNFHPHCYKCQVISLLCRSTYVRVCDVDRRDDKLSAILSRRYSLDRNVCVCRIVTWC